MSWFDWAKKWLADNKASGHAPPSFEGLHFSPQAMQALTQARNEAVRLKHNFLGTEHLLLGLIRLKKGMHIDVLQKLGVNPEQLSSELERLAPIVSNEDVAGGIPYTPRVKKVIALAQKEARALNHVHVSTEHMLLGLLSEGNGAAAKILQSFNVNLERARKEVLRQSDPNYLPDEDGKK